MTKQFGHQLNVAAFARTRQLCEFFHALASVATDWKRPLSLSFAIAVSFVSHGWCDEPESDSISIEYEGIFIGDTSVAGEQKSDWVQPSHPFCWQLSADRWMWIFQTRSFAGIDAEHSILYQIRKDKPDGAVIAEKLLAQFRDDWEAKGEGNGRFWKIHGHPKIFGVPRGAVDANGRPFPHDNLFMATWYVRPRQVAEDGQLLPPRTNDRLAQLQHLETIHFRINDAGNDIDILTPATMLRQEGFESGESICSAYPKRVRMNQWQRPAIPLDAEHTRWIDTPHFGSDGIAAIEYRFDPKTRRYEWFRTGPVIQSDPKIKGRFFEGSLNRVGDEWMMAIRNRGHILRGRRGECTAWVRTHDPLAGWSDPVYAPIPSSYCPRVAYQMADGVLRIFSGELMTSPYRQKRNPLYCWDVNPKDYSVSNRRVILDARKHLDIAFPMIGFAKLSPIHQGRQILTFRVTTQNHIHATETMPAVTKAELAQCGAHYAVVTYGKGVSDTWRFSKDSSR